MAGRYSTLRLYHSAIVSLCLQLYTLLLYCYTAMLLCCHTAVLLYCHTAMLPYCYAAILLYCCTAVLLYCYTAVLLCLQLHTTLAVSRTWHGVATVVSRLVVAD